MLTPSKKASNVSVLTHLFNPRIRLSYLPTPWKEAKVVTLLKQDKDPKSPRYFRLNILLTTMGIIFEKVIHKIVQMHIDEWRLLTASQVGFRERHSTTLQNMTLMDHVNFL
jgi:hypothetical protein